MTGQVVRSLADLRSLSADPLALEDVALASPPTLVVDLSELAEPRPDGSLEPIVAWLLAVPAVTIGHLDSVPHRVNHSLLSAFDIIVGRDAIAIDAGPHVVPGDNATIDELVAAVARQPRAAVVCTQLLRLSTGARVEAALTAESLAYSTLQAGPDFAGWLATRTSPARSDDSSTGPVVTTRIGSLLEVTLYRPHRRNAYNSAMRDALVEALSLAASDPTIDGVLLRGHGTSFCSGGDLDEFGSSPDPTTGHLVRTTRNAGYWLDRLAGRVRANVHGACVGAGIELPSFCGTVIARRDAWFQLPEVAMGLIPGAGGTVSITRRIGRQRTNYLAISGARLDATAALGWGLVDRLVDEL